MGSPPAKHNQSRKFLERRKTTLKDFSMNGHNFVALQNVYDTSIDTELMADVVEILPDQTFVEIGCGTGAVTILTAMKAKQGLGVDINPAAVKNAKLNAKKLKINNVEFKLSDVFDNVEGEFDVVICNPPYSAYTPSDEVEMMFWDKDDAMKLKFFNQLNAHLKKGGKLYFGWADFADIDQDFPTREAAKIGLKCVERFARKEVNAGETFYVYEFVK